VKHVKRCDRPLTSSGGSLGDDVRRVICPRRSAPRVGPWVVPSWIGPWVSAALAGGTVCASPIVGGLVYCGAEGLQRYTPISTSSSLCEVETGSLHAYPGFSPALVAIFWQACRPAPLAQAFNDLFRRTVKAAPTSARASALTSCCASGFSPTRGPRQFRGLGVNLFSAPRRLGLPLDPGRGRLALETAAGP
jgi:hypothetical protein